MRPTPGSNPELTSLQRRRHGRSTRPPFLAALVLGAVGFIAIGLGGAGHATAANPTTAPEPTMSPFATGRHVYDYAQILSEHSVTIAEALATKIEGEGGGRVVIYTGSPDTVSSMPSSDDLIKDWHIDGLLLYADSESNPRLTVGTTLTAKLTTDQGDYLTSSSFFSSSLPESSMMNTLGWTDALLAGTHVIDAAGVLDASGLAQAEAAAKDLSTKVGGTAYINIVLSGADPESTASATASEISTGLSKSLAICFGVKGSFYGGSVDADPEIGFESYKTSDPWASNGVLSNRTASGSVQAAILTAIAAVHSSSLTEDLLGAALPWIIFTIVIVVLSLFGGGWLMRKMTGVTGPIKGGVPSSAIIEGITDTGVTTTGMGAGPEAPEYKFDLQVTPVGGGAPYPVVTKALVPRVVIPMVVPGATVGVLIDPTNPQKASIDFNRLGGGFPAGGFGAAAQGGVTMTPAGPGGFGMSFDASGQPAAADVAALAGGVRSGAVKQIKGSADQLLATGAHGTAVITTAQPLGMTVRQVNPAADPSRLDDPMWLFTVEVTLPGQAPFPAVFGHRVPIAKVASVAPGVTLAVAVDEADKNQDVAIDWERSPIGS